MLGNFKYKLWLKVFKTVTKKWMWLPPCVDIPYQIRNPLKVTTSFSMGLHYYIFSIQPSGLTE